MKKIQVVVLHTGSKESSEMVFVFKTDTLLERKLSILRNQLGEKMPIKNSGDDVLVSFPESKKSYAQVKTLLKRYFSIEINRKRVDLLPDMPDCLFEQQQKHWSYGNQANFLQVEA